MAVNYFIGRSVDQLEQDLQAAQDDLAAGKTIQDAGNGDISKREQIQSSIEKRIRMILRSLSIAAPDRYPPGMVLPTREFRVAFGPDSSSSQ